MKQNIILSVVLSILGMNINNAQFRTRDRMDRLESFDNQRFSWGFFLSGNNFDYKLNLDPTNGMSQNKQRNLIHSESSTGFGTGLIGKMSINDFLDLRVEPGLHFVERKVVFDKMNDFLLIDAFSDTAIATPQNFNTDRVRSVKSTYLDIPILLEFHMDRWYNSRPYIAGGVNYLTNLQSNENADEDNSQGVFRTTTHNFAWTAELGLQFYFNRFKLTPAIRGTFFVNNELVKDNPNTPPYWAGGITTAQTRAFMFVLKFE